MATINGSGAAVQNRTTITFTPGQGGEFGGRYEGPTAAILAKKDELIAQGFAVVYECDASPVATVTFKTPSSTGDQPPNPNADYVDRFQVLRNTVQKEILQSGHKSIRWLNATNLKQIKALFDNPTSATIPAGSLTPNEITNVPAEPNSYSAASYLWQLYSSGVRSVDVKQPVLRVTRETNPLYDAPFDLDYVDRVLSTSTMIADSGVPGNFAIGLISLATAVSRKTPVNASGYAIRADELLMKFGWLKDAITSETVGTTKNQYVIEYTFGLWEEETYGAVI